MARIPEDLLNNIRAHNDIVDVVSQYVQLTKRGSNYMASCPFHEDANPSFSVSPSKQIYKCFSCGRGGNVFGFLQEIEGISFYEAVLKAAELAHISLPPQYQQQAATYQRSDEESRLLELHQQVQAFYHYYLMDTVNGQSALTYLTDRGLTTETLKTFKLGYAPENPRVTADYLMQKERWTPTELRASGIFFETDTGEWLDRFQGRIIFPLTNEQGECVAFSGRWWQGASDNAKYLNSPETVIFDKGRLLYHLDQARSEIRRTGQALVCEGYMDVIALYQAGFKQAVATMGTSLTQHHLDRLSKIAQEVYFVFDGDQAGQQATARSFELSLPFRQADFKAVVIPGGADPDEWVKAKGAQGFQQLIDQALTRYDFLAYFLKSQYDLEDNQQLANYLEKLIELIAQIDSPIEQQLRLQDLIQQYQLSEDLVKEQLARARHRTSPHGKERSRALGQTTSKSLVDSGLAVEQLALPIQSRRAFESEKVILFNLIYEDKAWKFIESMDQPLLLFHDFSQKLYFLLQDYYYDQGYLLPLTILVDRIEDPALNHLFTSLIWEQERMPYQDELMVDCLAVIQDEFIEQEIKELREKLNSAMQGQRYNEINEILAHITRLSRQIK